MLNTILVDAGPLIALFDRDDNYHNRVISFLAGKDFRFVTTTAVLTEVSYMLNFNVQVQIDFFEWVLRRGVLLEEIRPEDMSRIIGWTKKYRDVPMDFADATLMLTAEKKKIFSIISLDSDFDIYRLPGKTMLENIFS
ncbi:PIN domain-containing protein [Treponema sp. TIM-1]|uniref:type II toxin-antitoxin system VapC family toxin n=1 Tax=Treponema sp. TIM-1 TaxID=2898417 RepID=UPI00397F4C50